MSSTVSVIIPVFNGVDFIAKSVQSALDQSHPPYEVIVVNDGSLDGTLDALAMFGSRIIVISIPNGGVSNARNVGIRASSGDLIAFLDADDVWRRDKLELQVAALRRYPEVGFCCCDYQVFYKHIGGMINHFSLFENEKDIIFDKPLISNHFEVLIKHNFVGTASNVIIRRSVLEVTGLFNVGYRQAEDYDLWLRSALITKFIILSGCLLEKSSHDTNLTNDFLETLLCHERVLLALRAQSKVLLKGSSMWDTSQLALAKTRYQIGNLWFEGGKTSKAFAYYFLGMRTWWSLLNFRLFSYYASRKLLRLMSFGLLRNVKAGR